MGRFWVTGTRELRFRLIDNNRNGVVSSTTVTTGLNTTGTYNGSFSNVYAGVFYIIAIFMCSGSNVSSYQTLEHVHGSTIDPPTGGGGGGEPTPVTDSPNTNTDLCIPTTGQVSMGDINIVLNRVRTTSNTLLSGSSNPSVSPSLFGLSFLPTTGTISKTRPNALSEFRGYCNVPPIINPTVFYSYNSDIPGIGSISIDYINTSGNSANVSITHSNTSSIEFNSSSFTAKAGSLVFITLYNNSFNISQTSLSVSENSIGIYNSGVTTDFVLQYGFVVNTDSTYSIISDTNG